MKKTLLLMFSLVLIISISSCKKKNHEKDPTPGLEGNWELRQVRGGSIAGLDPNFKAGNGYVIKFTSKEYEEFVQKKSISKHTYELKEEKRKINNNESTHSLKLSDGRQLYLSLQGKTLVVFLGVIAADGTESTYEKI